MDSGAQDERIGRRRAALPRRSRPRARFAEVGGEALPDYELLELVLFRSIPRRDVKPAAKELVRRFGSFAEVLSAPVHRLVAVDGVGESVASDLKIVEAQPDSWRRAPSSSVRCWPPGRRSSITAVRPWPSASEQFRLLFLDKRNALIADEVQQSGTVDHTPAYPREVVRRALELSATALVLVHNYPSGDPTPSSTDIRIKRDIMNVAKPLGITVHDHIIVGREGHASLKGLRLI